MIVLILGINFEVMSGGGEVIQDFKMKKIV